VVQPKGNNLMSISVFFFFVFIILVLQFIEKNGSFITNLGYTRRNHLDYFFMFL